MFTIMGIIAYGSLGLGVVIAMYSALTIASELDDIDEGRKENEKVLGLSEEPIQTSQY